MIRVAIVRLYRQSFYFSADSMIIARTLTCGDPYICNGFPNLLTESYNLHGCSHMIVSYNAERGDREGAPIHMPMIRLETVEKFAIHVSEKLE